MKIPRTACRIMAFTLAPMITDATGLWLMLYASLVAIGAAFGWADSPDWD